MPLPLQNIPEHKKDKEWAKQCVFSIVQMVGNTTISKQKDRFCYNLYNGIINEADFDYLRKVDKYEYPARIRFIPLLRPRLDWLKSQENSRPLVFRVFTVDKLSVENKQNEKARAIVAAIYNKLIQRNIDLQTLYQQVNEQQAQIDRAKQQQGANISPEQMSQMDAMRRQIEEMKAPLNSSMVLSRQELEKIDTYYRYEYKDFLEQISQNGLNYLIQHYHLKDRFNDGMEDKLCTDKEFYFVDYCPSDPDPVCRRVTPLNFYYSNDDEAEWVGDCEWAMEERFMTLPQIIDEFKNDLSTEDIEKLKRSYYYFSSYNYNNYSPYQYANSLDYNTEDCNQLYSGTTDYSNKIRVCMCVWKSVRQLKFKKSPNKYIEGSFYTKWIEDKDDQVDKLRNGQEYEIAYVNDVWEGVMIDRDVYLRLRKRPVQLRSVDNYSKVDLPYVGRANNGINRRPYSIVWAAKDIQLLYNIVHYHKELWLALSGVKGFIMDKSQMPDGMSMQEWIYQRKLGVGWIQTIREGVGRQPQFNQFQHFDDTVSPAIQYLTLILQHLEDLAGSVTGVSRQSLGAITEKDLKGTAQQAIQQSSIVTEVIFQQHDQVKRKCLERLINLCKIAWKDGKRGQYVLGDMAQEILNIPSGVMGSADFEVFMDDNGKQERALQEIRQLAFAEHSKGIITLPQIISMYNINNLKELEKMLEKYGEMAEQRAAQASQGEQQAEVDKIKMEQEFKAAIEREKNNILSVANELEKAKLDWEKQKFGREEKLKEKEMMMKSANEKYKVDADAAVEIQYLSEQKRRTNLDYRIKSLELGIESIKETISKIGEGRGQPKEKIKD